MRKNLSMILFIAVMIAGLLFTIPTSAFADAEMDDLINQITSEYVLAKEERRPVDSGKLLGLYETMLAKDPSNQEALNAVYALGPKTVLDAITKEGGLSKLVHELLRRGENSFIERVDDKEAIMKWVARLDDTDLDTRWEAVGTLVHKYGAFAVPYVIENLSTDTVENSRTGAIIFLNKLGYAGTLAVQEGLKAKDGIIRQTVATILGNIGDERALPALVAAIERATGDDAKYAKEAVQKITGEQWDQTGNAKQLYVIFGDRFYKGDARVLASPKHQMVWNWNEDGEQKLHGERVPVFAYNERLAEKFCYEALRLDAEYTPAWSLLACSFYAQEIEAQSVLKGAMARFGKEVEQGDLDAIKALADQVYRVATLSTSAGKDVLYAALTRALKDGTSEVAISVLHSLTEVESGADFPIALESGGYAESVQNALRHSDKRVRYAAAELLFKVNTLRDFTQRKHVIPALNDSLSETATRVILIVSDNLEFRNTFSGTLEQLGYFPVTANSRYDALTRARAFPSHDLVIIDNRLNRVAGEDSADSMLLLLDLKKDYRTKDTPVLLYDETAGDADGEGKLRIKQQFGDSFEWVKDVIFSADPSTYAKLIEAIFADRALEESREMAYRQAERSANIIASVDPQWSTFDVANLVPALIGNLKDRPDYLLIASAKCLGLVADKRSEGVLAGQFGNTDLSLPERLACAAALANVVKQTGSISNETISVLKIAIREGNRDIEIAAGNIFGCSPMSRKDRFKVYNAERPQIKESE